MCGIRQADSTWLRGRKRKVSPERAEDSETSEAKEGRLSELSVEQTVNSRQCTQLHNGGGGGSQCRVALLILDFLFLFLEHFRGFAEKLYRKLFMETVRPPCKTHNKRLFLIWSGLDQTVQVTHHLRHSLITVTWYRSLLKLCRAMETLPL